jgi:hypothetical protein
MRRINSRATAKEPAMTYVSHTLAFAFGVMTSKVVTDLWAMLVVLHRAAQ